MHLVAAVPQAIHHPPFVFQRLSWATENGDRCQLTASLSLFSAWGAPVSDQVTRSVSNFFLPICGKSLHLFQRSNQTVSKLLFETDQHLLFNFLTDVELIVLTGRAEEEPCIGDVFINITTLWSCLIQLRVFLIIHRDKSRAATKDRTCFLLSRKL